VILVSYSCLLSLVSSTRFDLNGFPNKYYQDQIQDIKVEPKDTNDFGINLNVVPDDEEMIDYSKGIESNKGIDLNELPSESEQLLQEDLDQEMIDTSNRIETGFDLNELPSESEKLLQEDLDQEIIDTSNGIETGIDLNELPIESYDDLTQTSNVNLEPYVEESIEESVQKLNENSRIEQVKHEGKAFVADKLEDFKMKSMDTKVLIPHLIRFNSYLESVIDKHLIMKLRNRIENVKEYNQEDDVLANDFEESIVKLTYALEWIEKRIEFLPEGLLKQEFTSNRKDLYKTIGFYKKLIKLLNELKESDENNKEILDKINREITQELSDKDFVKNGIENTFIRIKKLINLYKFMESFSNSNDNELKREDKEEFLFKIPTQTREERREGKAFVNKWLSEFNANSKSFIEDLEQILMYFQSSKSKYLNGKVQEILNKFDDVIKDPKSKQLIMEFDNSIHDYTSHYPDSFKLEYAIEWIEKRLEKIFDKNIKYKLMVIQQGFTEIKEYNKNVAEVIYPLQGLVDKLVRTDFTQKLANAIVKLIIKLREINFEEEEDDSVSYVTIKLTDLIEQDKQVRKKYY